MGCSGHNGHVQYPERKEFFRLNLVISETKLSGVPDVCRRPEPPNFRLGQGSPAALSGNTPAPSAGRGQPGCASNTWRICEGVLSHELFFHQRRAQAAIFRPSSFKSRTCGSEKTGSGFRILARK
jgi:hypothetical protein